MSPAVTFVASGFATLVSMTSTALCSTVTVAVAKSYGAVAEADVLPLGSFGIAVDVQFTVAWFTPVVGSAWPFQVQL